MQQAPPIQGPNPGSAGPCGEQSTLGSWATSHSGQTPLVVQALGQVYPVPRQRTADLDATEEARPIGHHLPGAGSPEPPRGGPQAIGLWSCVQILVLPPTSCVTLRSHFSGPVAGRQRGVGLRSQEGEEWGVRRMQRERRHPSNPSRSTTSRKPSRKTQA